MGGFKSKLNKKIYTIKLAVNQHQYQSKGDDPKGHHTCIQDTLA